MPLPLVACLVAVVLAAAVAAATPVLLRWCPVPADAEDLVPFVELASRRFRWTVFAIAAAAGCLALTSTEPAWWGVWAPLAALGSLLALVDLRTTYLPLRLHYLTLGLVVAGVGVAAGVRSSWAPLVSAAVTGSVVALVAWLLWRWHEEWFGFGDVRLVGLIGVATGSEGMPLPTWAFLLGAAAGGVWGVVAWLRRGRDGEFAYGPALLLGPLLALVIRRVWQLG